MTEYCWPLERERSSRDGDHDAPEDVSPIPPRMLSYPRRVLGGAVPGTQEAHDGQGTGVTESEEDQEVGDGWTAPAHETESAVLGIFVPARATLGPAIANASPPESPTRGEVLL
jgi:hypothetical protein